METEHIVETTAGEPASRTTIIRDSDSSSKSSGGGIWVAVLAILILGAVGLFAFGRMSDSEVAKDNAVAGAADAVGNAAENVGNAANNAADAVEEGVANATN